MERLCSNEHVSADDALLLQLLRVESAAWKSLQDLREVVHPLLVNNATSGNATSVLQHASSALARLHVRHADAAALQQSAAHATNACYLAAAILAQSITSAPQSWQGNLHGMQTEAGWLAAACAEALLCKQIAEVYAAQVAAATVAAMLAAPQLASSSGTQHNDCSHTCHADMRQLSVLRQCKASTGLTHCNVSLNKCIPYPCAYLCSTSITLRPSHCLTLPLLFQISF